MVRGSCGLKTSVAARPDGFGGYLLHVPAVVCGATRAKLQFVPSINSLPFFFVQLQVRKFLLAT